MRDEVRDYLVEHLGDSDGVLIIDVARTLTAQQQTAALTAALTA